MRYSRWHLLGVCILVVANAQTPSAAPPKAPVVLPNTGPRPHVTEAIPPTPRLAVPFGIRGLSGKITLLAAGHPHCALMESNFIDCWVSYNQFNTAVSRFKVFDDKFQFVEAGVRHGCGITLTGETRCWGSNTWGELGDGNLQSVSGKPPVTSTHVAVGENFSCAVSNEGRVHCWGRNDLYQLASTEGDETEPCKSMGCRKSPGSPIKLPKKAIRVAAGKSHACALIEDGSIQCWGENTFGQLGSRRSGNCPGKRKYKNSCQVEPVSVEQLGGKAKDVRAGTHFTCALLEDGDVKCWGLGTLGQLGSSDTGLCVEPITEKRNIPCNPKPAKIVGLTKPARALAVGDAHACAVLESSEVWCWGGNGYGELGDETLKSRPIPKPVKHIGPTVEQVSISRRRSCVLTNNNQVFCWPQPNTPSL